MKIKVVFHFSQNNKIFFFKGCSCEQALLGDGECDKACNSVQCNFDEGDCEGVVSNHYFHFLEEKK